MRSKKQIMKAACYEENFKKLEDKHRWLMLEVLCDIRDQMVIQSGKIKFKEEKINEQGT